MLRLVQIVWQNGGYISKPFIKYWCFVSVFLISSLVYMLCVHSNNCVSQRKIVFLRNRKQTFLGVILMFLFNVKLRFITAEVTGIYPLIILSLTVHRQALEKWKSGLLLGKEFVMKTFPFFFLVWQKLTNFGFVAIVKPWTAPEFLCFRIISAGCGNWKSQC